MISGWSGRKGDAVDVRLVDIVGFDGCCDGLVAGESEAEDFRQNLIWESVERHLAVQQLSRKASLSIQCSATEHSKLLQLLSNSEFSSTLMF
jgi:hypothetical protein